MKSRGMQRTGLVACRERGEKYMQVVVVKPEGKRPLARLRCN
jgi:hypothetical protein